MKYFITFCPTNYSFFFCFSAFAVFCLHILCVQYTKFSTIFPHMVVHISNITITVFYYRYAVFILHVLDFHNLPMIGSSVAFSQNKRKNVTKSVHLMKKLLNAILRSLRGQSSSSQGHKFLLVLHLVSSFHVEGRRADSSARLHFS